MAHTQPAGEITGLLREEQVSPTSDQKTLRVVSGALIVVGLLSAGVGLALNVTAPVAPRHVQGSYGGVSILDTDHPIRGLDRKKGNQSHPQCSWPLQNCTDSKCCNKPGQQCFMQNENTGYSSCMDSCVKGPHPTHWDGETWSCEPLGDRLPGSSRCSRMGEDCSETMCCEETNTQCFRKTEGWATCKTRCHKDAPDMNDMDGNWWSCDKLGPWTQGKQPWVDSQCSPEGQDCRSTQCCQTPGMMCYEQSEGWAQCQYDCTAGKNPERTWEPAWSCKEMGVRTPGAGPPAAGKLGSWVPETCSWQGDDCTKSHCCLGMNQQCFEKNKDWAVCKETCQAGEDPFDKNETWSCKPRGARSMGLAIKGSPSLYCWSLFQTTTYEMEIMKLQLEGDRGIFQCDEWGLLSTDEPTVIGKLPDGTVAKTMKVKWAEITTSVDGTAGNAKLFINTWNTVVDAGKWNNHAWTVKVDPDAVLLPDRLRIHLAPHVLENVYVVNCNKFPSSSNFPMMYGSLEIYSWKAIQTYKNSMSSCMDDMGMMIPQWGEDYFMTHCLDHIGVGRIADFASVGDNVCLGANCGDDWVAAFHPFKSVDEWKKCWDTAHR